MINGHKNSQWHDLNEQKWKLGQKLLLNFFVCVEWDCPPTKVYHKRIILWLLLL